MHVIGPIDIGHLDGPLGLESLYAVYTYAVSEDGRTKAEILEVLIGRLPVSEGGEPAYLGAVPSDIEAAKQCGFGQIWLMVSPDHGEESEVESVDTVYSISKFSALIEDQGVDCQVDSGL